MSKSKDTVPEIPKILLEFLENRFSSKIPTSKTITLDDFRYLQGQIAVIEFLRYHFDLQNKTVLGD